jgi:hypothetical protein
VNFLETVNSLQYALENEPHTSHSETNQMRPLNCHTEFCLSRIFNLKLAASMATFLACSTFALGADVFETIDERQAEYEKAIEDGRQDIFKAYAAAILKASDNDESDAVTRMSQQMKAFRASGAMMSDELYSDFIEFGTHTHIARSRLLTAYKDAAKQCIKELKFQKAEELQATIKARGLDSRLVSLRLASRHSSCPILNWKLGQAQSGGSDISREWIQKPRQARVTATG